MYQIVNVESVHDAKCLNPTGVDQSCVDNPNPPHTPRTSSSTQGPADLQGFACRLYFTMQRLLQAQSGYNFTGQGGAPVGGAGRGIRSCQQLQSFPHQGSRQRYRTRYRFRERTESSLMTEGVEVGSDGPGSQWRRQNGADGRHFRSFQCWKRLATAVPWRRELIRGREFHPAGSPQDIQVQKDNNNAPRRHEAGTMFEVWRGTKKQK